MMNADHKTAQLFFAETLREAETRRLQQELLRDAEAYSQRELREQRRSIVQRLIQHLRPVASPPEARDAHDPRRATAA